MKLPPPGLSSRRAPGPRAAAFSLAVPALCCFFLCFFVAPAAATAQVRQPTGEVMPQPVGMEELGIPMSRGFQPVGPGNWNVVTLEALFFAQGENLNPQRDAHTTPGTFSPLCGFRGQLVLHGGRCHLGLGWYNVTEGSTTPPPMNQIYPLVPLMLTAQGLAMYPMCPMPPMMPDPAVACYDDNDFSPLAVFNTNQAPQHRWSNPPIDAGVIANDPRYRGGLIGFVLIGAEDCSGNKFSQAELNQKNADGVPWVQTLIYQSTVDPNAYYIAFEDRAASVQTWKGPNNGNDGDFNDYVFKVSGVTCKGGGKPCDTMMPGLCKDGTTQCSNGGMNVACTPNIMPRGEVCDGLDNDCDGMTDDGAACPNADEICDKGKCVHPCDQISEFFKCNQGLVCAEDGYCKDPACISMTCGDGQICVGGVCLGGCQGVECPHGQVCRIGRCVDPCAGIVCGGGAGGAGGGAGGRGGASGSAAGSPANWVCENGACVPPCGPCRECDTGQVCGADKRCVEMGCEDPRKCASSPGTVCVRGACDDACQGVRCPGGQECKAGACVDMARPEGTGGMLGVIIDAGAPASGGRTGAGGRSGSAATGGSSDGGGGPNQRGVSTCQCEVDSGGVTTPAALACLALLSLVLRRRRRSGLE